MGQPSKPESAASGSHPQPQPCPHALPPSVVAPINPYVSPRETGPHSWAHAVHRWRRLRSVTPERFLRGRRGAKPGVGMHRHARPRPRTPSRAGKLLGPRLPAVTARVCSSRGLGSTERGGAADGASQKRRTQSQTSEGGQDFLTNETNGADPEVTARGELEERRSPDGEERISEGPNLAARELEGRGREGVSRWWPGPVNRRKRQPNCLHEYLYPKCSCMTLPPAGRVTLDLSLPLSDPAFSCAKKQGSSTRCFQGSLRLFNSRQTLKNH